MQSVDRPSGHAPTIGVRKDAAFVDRSIFVAEEKKKPGTDPAPSRTSYKLQRLLLTPFFHLILRAGLPVFAVVAAMAWYVSDDARVATLDVKLSEMRALIENRPEFQVNLMRIEDVSASLADDIREITAIDFPVSSFDLDLRALRGQIEQLDAVAGVDLVVRAGGILDVAVVERQPAIVWRGPRLLELLDAQGHRVAAIETRSQRSDLPLIVGESADQNVQEALAIYAAASPFLARLRGLSRVGERRWDMILQDDRRIMLPEADPIAALERVIALDAGNDLLARDFMVIDLRNRARPVVRLRDEVADAMHGLADLNSKDDPL